MPAHYGFVRSHGHFRSFRGDGIIFHFLRKTSDWSDAASATGATRSRDGMVRGAKQEFLRTFLSTWTG
jgi:hypothetical protein